MPRDSDYPRYRKSDQQIILWVTKEQRDRTKVLAKLLGKSMREIVHTGLLEHLEKLEAGVEREKERRERMRTTSFVPRNERQWDKPKGLGIEPKDVAPTPLSMKPDTLALTDDVERLIAYVASATTEAEVEARGKTVLDIIVSTCTEDQAYRVGKRLDEEIRRLKTDKQADPRVGQVLDIEGE